MYIFWRILGDDDSVAGEVFSYLSRVETFSGFQWNELYLEASIFECLTSTSHKFVRDDIETRTMIAGPLSIVDPCQGLVDNFSTPRFRDGLRAPQSFTLLRFLRAQLKDWPHVWCILFLFLFATCASLPATRDSPFRRALKNESTR